MDVIRAGQIVVIMLSPTIVVAAVLYVPRGVRAVRRLVRRTAPGLSPQPAHPPIEQIAADLRRLLLRHETLRLSTEVAVRAKHLRALEAAITDCALDAARALGLSCPDRPAHDALAKPELRRLLQSLAEAGLVLPPAVGLLAADRRL